MSILYQFVCSFDEIQDEATLMIFFEKHYPDSIALIGRERLCSDYFQNKPSMLISIKACDVECTTDCKVGPKESVLGCVFLPMPVLRDLGGWIQATQCTLFLTNPVKCFEI